MTFIIGIYEKKDYFLASFDWQQLLSRERFFEFICITFLNVLGNLVVIWKILDRKLLKMAFPQRIWLKQIRSKISSQWDFSRQKYNLPPLPPLKKCHSEAFQNSCWYKWPVAKNNIPHIQRVLSLPLLKLQIT